MKSMKLVIPSRFMSCMCLISYISKKCILPNMIGVVNPKLKFHECDGMTIFMNFMSIFHTVILTHASIAETGFVLHLEYLFPGNRMFTSWNLACNLVNWVMAQWAIKLVRIHIACGWLIIIVNMMKVVTVHNFFYLN